MTPEGSRRIGRLYGPMVVEGSALFEGISAAEIQKLIGWLVGARALTDRHRDRVRGS